MTPRETTDREPGTGDAAPSAGAPVSPHPQPPAPQARVHPLSLLSGTPAAQAAAADLRARQEPERHVIQHDLAVLRLPGTAERQDLLHSRFTPPCHHLSPDRGRWHEAINGGPLRLLLRCLLGARRSAGLASAPGRSRAAGGSPGGEALSRRRPASRRLIRGCLRACLRDAGCLLLRRLASGCAAWRGSRTVPRSRAAADHRHRLRACTVIVAGTEDHRDRYEHGRCQHPGQQQRGPQETQTLPPGARAGAPPAAAGTPESPSRACRHLFPVRHLLTRCQPGERGQKRRQFRVRSSEPALDRVQGLLLPRVKAHPRRRPWPRPGSVAAPWPGQGIRHSRNPRGNVAQHKGLHLHARRLRRQRGRGHQPDADITGATRASSRSKRISGHLAAASPPDATSSLFVPLRK